MLGFPLPLYDSGNSPVNLANADSGFPKPGVKETFFSIKTGSWTDPSVWQTASERVGILPTANDDVYIRHDLSTAFGVSQTVSINNLFIINGVTLTITAAAGTSVLAILGNLQCKGTIDGSGSAVHYIKLFGLNNRLDNYSNGSNSTIVYAANTNQNILSNITYYNLAIEGDAAKYLMADTTISGGLVNGTAGVVTTKTVLECGSYNLTVNGTSTFSFGFSKNNAGNLLFIGSITMSGLPLFRLDGNPNVEFRNGVSFQTFSPSGQIFYSGTGTWSFTTNNQSFSRLTSISTMTLDCTLSIDSGITLTINEPTGNSLTLNNTVNGVSGTSKLLMGSSSILIFATQIAAENSMSTGIADFTTNANSIQFNGNYTATIPSYYTTFSSLAVQGTGTKTLSVNTTINANLSLSSSGTLECSTFSLTITGTTTIGSATLSKNSSTGSLLFVGLFTNGVGGNITLSGNPNSEFRGGITFTNSSWNMGSGTVSFTTNNQSITDGGGSLAATLGTGPVSIVGAITVTIAINNSEVNVASIDCTSASGSLINKGKLNINTNTASMTTGTFDISSFANTVGYVGNYSLTLPLTTYYSLKITGTGTKTLGGNTTLSGNLTIASGGTLELSTFNFTVNGTVSNSATLSKSGNGNVLFVGLYTASPGNTTFSSSPVVEFRGGILYTNHTFTWTSSTVKFTTNNQAVTFNAGTVGITFPNITVSGAITLTIDSSAATTIIITGTLDGDNASSKLLMATNSLLNYKSATKPFATNGILDTSTNTNTWTYGLNNQDILGGPSVGAKQVYKNLTLNGTGTKTLQGYVSVLNTYTLTAPATLNNNGFTLTNP